MKALPAGGRAQQRSSESPQLAAGGTLRSSGPRTEVNHDAETSVVLRGSGCATDPTSIGRVQRGLRID